MRMTKRNSTKVAKKRNLLRHEQQREMFFKRKLEMQQYQYDVTPKTYSSVKCQLHELNFSKELPGRDAFKEVLTFLKTFETKKGKRYYILALKSAQYKVGGRKYEDYKGNKSVITTLSDIEQVMKDSMEVAGIYGISVRDFVYSQL